MYSFETLLMLLYIVFQSAMQMFPSSIRPQRLAAFVQKACAWLVKGAEQPLPTWKHARPPMMTPAYPKIDSKILCMCVPVSENRAPLIWPQSLYLQKGESSYCEVARKQKRRGKAGLCGALREEGGKRWLLKARRAMQKEGRGLVGKDFRCRGLYKRGRKQKGR